MFVSPAFAQAAGDPGAAGGLAGILPLILIFVVFYFLLIRPQQKKMKQHKEMLGAIRRGDKVVTGGGIIGTVNKVVNDDELSVEIAENLRVRVKRAMVAEVLSKTEPVAGKADEDEGGSEGGETTAAAGDESASGKLKGLLGGKKDS